MKKNTHGFSLIIGMGLVVVISLSAYVILAYMVPFSRDVKGVENASNAYYQSYAGIENALYHVASRPTINTETGKIMPNTSTGFSYSTVSSGTTIPAPGEGNSEFDTNYNIISMTEPIQLEVGKGYVGNYWVLAGGQGWNSIQFAFKVPDTDTGSVSNNPETLSGLTLPIVNWMLSSENDTLIASGSYITASEIKGSNYVYHHSTAWKITNQVGYTLSGSSMAFEDFFDDNCTGTNSGCTLKMSIVNNLHLNDSRNTRIPYLEYKLVPYPYIIPDRYTKINATGKSFGFQKDLEVKVPQQTVNQALDFTLFQ